MYDVGRFVSVEQEGGLPQFSRIEQFLLVNSDVMFLCREHKSCYIEHLRSYKLYPGNLTVNNILELNDSSPLSAYHVEGQLLLTPKRFIQLQRQQFIPCAQNNYKAANIKLILKTKVMFYLNQISKFFHSKFWIV